MKRVICNIVARMHASRIFYPIYFILKKSGLHRVGHSLFDYFEMKYPTEEMKSTQELYAHNKKKMQYVRELFADERSREVFDKITQYRVTKDRRFLRGIIEERDQYFPLDIIKLSKNECFIDCGAFDGDTIIEFLERVNGEYKKIVAFEPDQRNFTMLKERARDVEAINAGVWDKDEVLNFSGTGTADSTIVDCDGTRINVRAIDNCLECASASFIKMDIEGAELRALEGAKKTILNNKPKLAICVYHKPEDIYEIPTYLHSICPQYKFYLRHHLYAYMDTVLYAVYDNNR